MRPGFQNSIMAPFDLPVASRCLHCHTSDVQLEIPGTRNRYGSLPFMNTGITCEACNRASTGHIASRGKERVLNPATLDPFGHDSICQHRPLEGEILIARGGDTLERFDH